MNYFLPDDYEAPKGASNYFKPQDGENKIRILSPPIVGWLDWSIEPKKPLRFRYHDKPAAPIDPKRPVKHFWAMIIWNYATSSIQIAEFTQGSIRSSLEALSKDEDWGMPYHYDIKIVKKGTDLKTEYAVNPVPAKPVHNSIKEAFYIARVSLEALFDGADPFAVSPKYIATMGVFGKGDVAALEKSNEIQYGTQFDTLKGTLEMERVDTLNLKEYIQYVAQKKGETFERVVEASLFKDLLPQFKTSYQKWLSARLA